MPPLEEKEKNRERYRRQLIIDGWGEEGQERLANSRAFIAGAGGLGCPVAMGLACAGVGTITICDSDRVELSNLNRQFLHTEENLGTPKAESARQALSRRNSTIRIITLTEKISDDNVAGLIGDVDIILDCLDNFTARLALNRYSVDRGIPLVHGAIWGMEGRVTFIHPPHTPCLGCLYPAMPPAGGEIPVLGSVAAATGNIQATEAVLHLRGTPPSLAGSLLILDYATMHFQRLTMGRDRSCSHCAQP